MPSHIFTRLGLWEDSIASNLAAREAAREQGDTGEVLHAMDYLVYAYLQSGRDADAARVIQQLREIPGANAGDFKIQYASTAMPVRYAVERRQWSEAAAIVAPAVAPPQVVAIAVWARALGLAGRDMPSRRKRKLIDCVRSWSSFATRARTIGLLRWKFSRAKSWRDQLRRRGSWKRQQH